MPLQILIADNDPHFLQATKEFLDDEFETISAKNPDEAKLVFQNNPLLGAIVMDGRLTWDDDEKDQSGWELAQEAQERGLARAPIIMYSRYEQSNQINRKVDDQSVTRTLPRISHLEKQPKGNALVKQILDEIYLNLREAKNLGHIPRYHQPPILAFAPNNGVGQLTAELRKNGETAEILETLPQLERAATIYPSALFAVDVSDRAGIEAIQILKKSRGIPDQNFYIVALTQSDDFQNETLPGVNAYVTRHSPQTDALELIMQMSQVKIQMEKIAAQKPLTQLALLQYEELLKELAEGNQTARVDLTSSLETVERALTLPFLTSKEALILSSLHSRMLAAGANDIDPETRALLIEGASMLTRNRAHDENAHEWMERARTLSDDFTFSWIDDRLLSGDEESDD